MDVLIIHYEDRFVECVPPNVYLWPVEMTAFGPLTSLTLGKERISDAAADTCIATGSGRALGRSPDSMSLYEWHDDAWKVPELDQLVMYELQVAEFNATFDGVIDRLAYLASLGVNCIELLPVTSLQLDFDWGYGPLHYFAPNERWGGAPGLKRLVDACHVAKIAVILDVVFQHTAETFPYYLVYVDAGNACGTPGKLSGPMMTGKKGKFGPPIDYHKPFSLAFTSAVTRYWLEEFHVDGFRYDEAGDLVGADEVPRLGNLSRPSCPTPR